MKNLLLLHIIYLIFADRQVKKRSHFKYGMSSATSIHAFCPEITVNCKKKKKERAREKQFKTAWRAVAVITRHHQQQS